MDAAWVTFCGKGECKAFARGLDSREGSECWGAVWGMPSQYEAVRAALDRCAKHTKGRVQVLWPEEPAVDAATKQSLAAELEQLRATAHQLKALANTWKETAAAKRRLRSAATTYPVCSSCLTQIPVGDTVIRGQLARALHRNQELKLAFEKQAKARTANVAALEERIREGEQRLETYTSALARSTRPR
ncbi:hypothetical protein DIPPA_06552 [Diplonema papillatum]|nr:hypothetical protein DIPPA_06552 [Diplonema papillatum]